MLRKLSSVHRWYRVTINNRKNSCGTLKTKQFSFQHKLLVYQSPPVQMLWVDSLIMQRFYVGGMERKTVRKVKMQEVQWNSYRIKKNAGRIYSHDSRNKPNRSYDANKILLYNINIIKVKTNIQKKNFLQLSGFFPPVVQFKFLFEFSCRFYLNRFFWGGSVQCLC